MNNTKLNRWIGLLVTFCVGQGAWQILRLFTGFLLIHWLTKDQYASYTLILAIKGSAAVLLDLGISSGLMALIARRCHEPKVVGRYIAVAKFFRDRLIAIGVFALLIAFYATASRFDWSMVFALQVWALVVLSIYFESRDSFYNPILSLQQRLKEKYTIRVFGLLMRFLMVVVLYFMGMLTVTTVLALAMLESLIAAAVVVRCTVKDVVFPEPTESLELEKKEALSLTLPKVPGVVFYALQGQVTIFIIGLVGEYNEIASLGALSKMGLLFMMPSAFTSALVIPWYSKLDAKHALRGFLVMMLLFSSFGGGLILLNLIFPQVFLFLLGDSYASLQHEIFLYSILSVFNLLAQLTYALTSTRKWVYYWTGPVTIVSYTTTLIGFLLFLDMSKLSSVIWFSIFTAFLTFLINQIVFLVGYRRSRHAH